MRPLSAVLLAASLALAACGTSPCQELGERICKCQPGLDSTTCKSQVERLLKSENPGKATCEALLDSCNAPSGLDLCEWMLTEPGRAACGLTPGSTTTP